MCTCVFSSVRVCRCVCGRWVHAHMSAHVSDSVRSHMNAYVSVGRRLCLCVSVVVGVCTRGCACVCVCVSVCLSQCVCARACAFRLVLVSADAGAREAIRCRGAPAHCCYSRDSASPLNAECNGARFGARASAPARRFHAQFSSMRIRMRPSVPICFQYSFLNSLVRFLGHTSAACRCDAQATAAVAGPTAPTPSSVSFALACALRTDAHGRSGTVGGTHAHASRRGLLHSIVMLIRAPHLCIPHVDERVGAGAASYFFDSRTCGLRSLACSAQCRWNRRARPRTRMMARATRTHDSTHAPARTHASARTHAPARALTRKAHALARAHMHTPGRHTRTVQVRMAASMMKEMSPEQLAQALPLPLPLPYPTHALHVCLHFTLSSCIFYGAP
jgi:hypothetical protein